MIGKIFFLKIINKAVRKRYKILKFKRDKFERERERLISLPIG
jgi:hypothetical protein